MAHGTPAQQALLRRSDIGPDWTAIALPSGNTNLTCPNFDPDLSAFTVNGKASSSFVQSGLAQVSSSIEVYASQAQAAYVAADRPRWGQRVVNRSRTPPASFPHSFRSALEIVGTRPISRG